MTLSIGRTLLAATVVALCGAAAISAQEPDREASPFNPSIARIRAALETPPPMAGAGASLFPPRQPNDFRFGVLTLAQPQPNDFRLGVLTLMQCPTLFICVNVPIGDLISRAAHSVSAAERRRVQNAARADVVNALAQFQKARQN
jgi:hypothetical protein